MSAFLSGFFVAFHTAEASANCMKLKHMEEREMNQKHSLTEGNILRSLLTFAIPVLFSLLLQALYGGADLLIVGRFADTVDVSGVATGSMLLSTVTNIITGLSMGITIAVAEKIGLKKERDAGKAIAYRSHCLPDQHCRRPSSGGRGSYGSRWCRNSHGAGPGGQRDHFHGHDLPENTALCLSEGRYPR